jgi:hypothetical protein
MADKKGSVAKLYDSFLAFNDDATKRRRRSKIVAHGKDIVMSSNRMGKVGFLIEESLGFDLANIVMFRAKIPQESADTCTRQFTLCLAKTTLY